MASRNRETMIGNNYSMFIENSIRKTTRATRWSDNAAAVARPVNNGGLNYTRSFKAERANNNCRMVSANVPPPLWLVSDSQGQDSTAIVSLQLFHRRALAAIPFSTDDSINFTSSLAN